MVRCTALFVTCINKNVDSSNASQPPLVGQLMERHWLGGCLSFWVTHQLPHRPSVVLHPRGYVLGLHLFTQSHCSFLTHLFILQYLYIHYNYDYCPTADQTHKMASHDTGHVRLLVSRQYEADPHISLHHSHPFLTLSYMLLSPLSILYLFLAHPPTPLFFGNGTEEVFGVTHQLPH